MSTVTELARVAFGRNKQSRFGRVGTALTVLGIVRRALKQKPETVFREELHPGEGFEIRAVAPEPDRRRGHRRRAARR